MNPAILATIGYGLLSAAGGIWGYLKSNSKPSLISGSISGVLLIVAGVMQWRGYSLGLLLGKIIILLLAVVFTIRLVKTKKLVPSGIMLIAGVAALVCLFA